METNYQNALEEMYVCACVVALQKMARAAIDLDVFAVAATAYPMLICCDGNFDIS